MITAAETTVIRCIIDDLPIDVSPAYHIIKTEIGAELANKWTTIETIHVDLKSGDP